MDKLDEDGYPTDEFLQSIRDWKVQSVKDAKAWMEHIREGWFYEDYFDGPFTEKEDEDGPVYEGYRVSTGGWSGHEDTISAMQDNFFGWYYTWYSTRRGGHYEFRLKD